MRRVTSLSFLFLALCMFVAGLSGCNSSSGGSFSSAPTITSFTANPTAVTAGASSSLTGVFSSGTGVITPGNVSVTSGTTVSVSPTDTTTYTLTVTNAAGATTSKTATVGVNPVVPAMPSNLTATAGNASVVLSWTASAGATSYNVYRGTTAGGESTTALATGITTTTHTDTTAANGTKYYYKVAAVNGGGTSTLSNEASAMPEPPIPAAPTGLTATAGNASVSLSWTASTGAASYNVYRGITSGGESTTPIATGITTTLYSDTGLTNGQRYYYEVAAVNGGGTSPMSNEASATPEPPAPGDPTSRRAAVLQRRLMRTGRTPAWLWLAAFRTAPRFARRSIRSVEDRTTTPTSRPRSIIVRQVRWFSLQRAHSAFN